MLRYQIVIALLFVQLLCGGASPAAGQQSNRQQASVLYNQAGVALRSNDYATAVPLLKQAVQIDDSFAAAHANLGWSLVKLGQMAEGKSEMEKATTLDPKLAAPWSNLAPIYVKEGNLPAAAKAYEKFLALTDDAATRKQYEDGLAFIKKQIAEGADSGGPDYFKAATKSGWLVWSKKRMPIKVFLESGEGVPGFKPVYDQLLRQAFADWADASAGKIAFTYVPTKESADIVCAWTHDASRVQHGAEGGQCSWQGAVDDGLHHADVLLLTLDPPGMKLTDAMIGWLTHHEIGHALGIHGHSGSALDIMFFAGTGYTQTYNISERDKATLARLYSAAY